MTQCIVLGNANENSLLSVRSYKALPTWLRRFTPAYLYVRILDSGIQELKKAKTAENYELALDILTSLIFQTAFRQHKKAGWYAEKALILHSLLHRCDEVTVLFKY